VTLLSDDQAELDRIAAGVPSVIDALVATVHLDRQAAHERNAFAAHAEKRTRNDRGRSGPDLSARDRSDHRVPGSYTFHAEFDATCRDQRAPRADGQADDPTDVVVATAGASANLHALMTVNRAGVLIAIGESGSNE